MKVNSQIYNDSTDIYTLVIHIFIKHCLNHIYIYLVSLLWRCYMRHCHVYRSKKGVTRRWISKTQVTASEMSWNIFKTCENWHLNHISDGSLLKKFRQVRTCTGSKTQNTCPGYCTGIIKYYMMDSVWDIEYIWEIKI